MVLMDYGSDDPSCAPVGDERQTTKICVRRLSVYLTVEAFHFFSVCVCVCVCVCFLTSFFHICFWQIVDIHPKSDSWTE